MNTIFIERQIVPSIENALARGKSILLLGPRQCGKTTIIEKWFQPKITLSFLLSTLRQRYEQSPDVLIREIEAELKSSQQIPLVFIDEVQKIPPIMDTIQYLIDKKMAQFILTGSSARKLRRGQHINLLPGRIIVIRVDPLNIQEISHLSIPLEHLLSYGSLPEIVLETKDENKEETLHSYVNTYLEEEIRAEALVRKVGQFSRFLELTASEAGGIINLQNLSQTLGVTRVTIQNYFDILEDCLVAEKIEPFLGFKNNVRHRLSKSSKYLLFDLGIRRVSAKEGAKLPHKIIGYMFEQFIGLELLRQIRTKINECKVCYWRDHNGPEVDYVLVQQQKLIPIEVKWTETPTESEAKHLKLFMDLYNVKQGYIVCRTPRKMMITPDIIALPWQLLFEIIHSHL